MKPATTVLTQSPTAAQALNIRLASPADAGALDRLAQLDCADPPGRARMLVAEVGGDLQAALPLDGGPAIANPFRRTSELVAMLADRARQLEGREPQRAGRLPRLALRALATASRA